MLSFFVDIQIFISETCTFWYLKVHRESGHNKWFHWSIITFDPISCLEFPHHRNSHYLCTLISRCIWLHLDFSVWIILELRPLISRPTTAVFPILLEWVFSDLSVRTLSGTYHLDLGQSRTTNIITYTLEPTSDTRATILTPRICDQNHTQSYL